LAISITESTSHFFETPDLKRGYEYYEAECVRKVKVRDGIATVDVEGSWDNYKVVIDIAEAQNGKIDSFDCTCPHFEDGYNCKHIWAAMLTLDSMDLPMSVAQNPSQERESSKGGAWQPFVKALTVARAESSRWNTHLWRESSKSIAKKRRVFYVVDAQPAPNYDPLRPLMLRLFQQEMRASGQWGTVKDLSVRANEISQFEAQDRAILRRFVGFQPTLKYYEVPAKYNSFGLTQDLDLELTHMLEASGSLYISRDGSSRDLQPATFDFAESYQIKISVEDSQSLPESSEFRVHLHRGGERLKGGAFLYLAKNGVGVCDNRIIKVENTELIELLLTYRNSAEDILIRPQERDAFIEQFLRTDVPVEINFPKDWAINSATPQVQGKATLSATTRQRNRILIQVSFYYGESEYGLEESSAQVYDPSTKTLFRRDWAAEQKLLDILNEFPITESYGSENAFLRGSLRGAGVFFGKVNLYVVLQLPAFRSNRLLIGSICKQQ
jgi:hypothetical protein